ncbi:Wzz/FepE/Etk N-terminal domain-containing protein [Pedobacter agri]|uniref:Wzz/FepE/Etk N-terminal domain-containing protein n=1 Tax=Pedobacter agri TaxID=454586 RepID=UPI0029316D13|nr:Wzz/FepE/Etk N-terminal domain-containing protein [Pedobacter agri]
MTEGQREIIDNKSDELSLKDLILMLIKWWKYILSKWIIILVFGLLGGVLGFWYAFNKKPIYTATTTFVLEDEKAGGGLGNLAGLASMAGVDVGSGGGIFQGDNILELYRSRKMLQQTLLTTIKVDGKDQSLLERYIQFNDLHKGWAERPELMNLQFKADSLEEGNLYLKPNRLRDSLLTVIVGDISKNYLTVAKPDKKLSVIKVDVKAKDEFFAKAFNEAIVRTVNDFYLQTKTKKSLQNVQIMQRKTDSVRAVMNGAIYSAVAVADATPNLNPTRQVQRVAPAQRAQFSAETNKAILGSLVQNLEMSKLTLMKETPLLEVIDQPVYPLQKEKFGKLKGLIFGGLIFGVLTIIVLLIRKAVKNILE